MNFESRAVFWTKLCKIQRDAQSDLVRNWALKKVKDCLNDFEIHDSNKDEAYWIEFEEFTKKMPVLLRRVPSRSAFIQALLSNHWCSEDIKTYLSHFGEESKDFNFDDLRVLESCLGSKTTLACANAVIRGYLKDAELRVTDVDQLRKLIRSLDDPNTPAPIIYPP